MKKILITPRAFAKSGREVIRELEKKGYSVIFNDTGKSYSPEVFLNLAKDADGIIIGVDKADRKVLESCTHLKAISKYGVGVDNIDMEAAKELGISISRALGANSQSVAEHTMALLLDLAKNVTRSTVSVRSIGFGNIGKRVARMAQGFGMQVYAYDVFPIDPVYAEENKIHIAELEELLTSSDVVTVHLPLTDETENLINAETMDLMKDSAYLINAARGGIVNEQDLYQTLKNGKLAGAGFDVFSTEPPCDEEPLLSLDNFLLTPHTASKTKEADDNTIRISVENLLKDLQ